MIENQRCIQLPIIDGYTATRKIKADPAMRSIPIIAVTSYALSGEEKKARAATVMITFRNPSAHVNYWRRLGNICPKPGRRPARLWTITGRHANQRCQCMAVGGGLHGICEAMPY